MAQNRWTREQLLQALSLYCQIPFGKIHETNPLVIALATQIGRTPGAVSFKLSNFASLDPELQRRGVRGLTNVSDLDREIWAEFYGKWDVLAAHSPIADTPLVESESASGQQGVRRAPRVAPVGPTEVMREVAQRRGQSFFRAAVLAANDSKCCVTGITCDALLRASHIVPWASDETLRLDPRNGLCLNALHDAAFDRGLITFTDRFELKLSKRLKAEVPRPVYEEMFASRAGKVIEMPERFRPAIDTLILHRERSFMH